MSNNGSLIVFSQGLFLENNKDFLACKITSSSGQASDKIRKDTIGTFPENFGLKITITTNLKAVNFLDVTFNLYTEKYQPFEKPNGTLTYINVNSNHPSDIIKALPNNIPK